MMVMEVLLIFLQYLFLKKTEIHYLIGMFRIQVNKLP
jgi:hypothetical protein